MVELKPQGDSRHGGASRIAYYAWFALLAGFALRLFIIIAAPVHDLGEGYPAFNDEISHYNHILFLHTLGNTPEQRMGVGEEQALTRGEVEYSQPPLYYLVVSGVVNLIRGTAFEIMLIRFLSLILWAFALWYLVRSLPNQKWKNTILLAGGILGAGFIPSTTINNDALFALFIAIVYALTAKSTLKEMNLRQVIVFSLVFTLTLWTKLSALALFPMIIATVVTSRRTKRYIYSLVSLGIVVIGSLPLWITRAIIYGHPLSVSEAASGVQFQAKDAVISLMYTTVCPWMEFFPSWFVKLPALLFFLFLAVSGAVFLLKWKRSTDAISLQDRRILLLWLLGAICVIPAWLYYAVRFHQFDMRLLLPASPFLVVFLGHPLWSWGERKQKIAGWVVAILLVIPFLAWGLV